MESSAADREPTLEPIVAIATVGIAAFAAGCALTYAYARRRRSECSEATLARVRERARSDLDAARVLLVGLDLDGRIVLLNRTGSETLGVTEQSVLGEGWFDTFVPEDGREQALASFRAFAAAAEGPDRPHTATEYTIVDAHGRRRLIAWNRSVVRDAEGRPTSVLSSGEDVTVQRRVEEELRLEAYLLDSVSDAIVMIDTDERLLYVNSAAAQVHGMTREEMVACGRLTDVSQRYAGLWERYRDDLLAGEDVVFDIEVDTPEGDLTVLEVHAATIDYQGSTAVTAVARDITERRQTEQRIRQIAFHDPLTGLANRLLLNDRLEHALGLARRRDNAVAIIFMDFDDFKDLNDTHGHLAGDRLLAMAAERIRSRVRSTDTVARFGGDEFAVVLPDVAAAADAQAVAEAIRAGFEPPFELGDEQVSMHASVGVAFSADGRLTPDELMRLADSAMYAAKRRGGNCVVVSEHIPA